MSLVRSAFFALVVTTSTGCYEMTFANGKVPVENPVIDNTWRSASVLDAVEIDKPILLNAACKETGWASIHQEHTPLNWAVDVFLAGGVVYESTRVDVVCAKPSGEPAMTPAVTTVPPAPEKAL